MNKDNKDIYSKIGFRGLVGIVWKSTPFYARFSLPYGLLIYKDLLSNSSDLNELRIQHADKYISSAIFRLLRPKYRKIKEFLRESYERV